MTDQEPSPWRAGRLGGQGRERLLFGATYEDVAVEEEALSGAERILVIGASGDTAMHLARADRRVTAVDVNPAQVDYLHGRLLGAHRRRGAAERMLAAARLLGPAAGWGSQRVERFLRLSDVDVQVRIFDQMLDTARFRALMDVGFAPATLLRAYRPEFVSFLPARFGRVLRERVRRGIGTHPNLTNPYARLLMTGQPPRLGCPSGSVEVHLVEAAAFLEREPPRSYDGFALSNVLDGPNAVFRSRLAEAVARAGRPDAPVVLRTLRQPTDRDAEAAATRDRSMIWGGIIVTSAATVPDSVRAVL